MKRLLFLIPALILAQLTTAQTQDTTFWRYAEISGITGGFSSKVKVEVNYGENVSGWFKVPEMLNDPATGKPIKFNSMVDALNYLSIQGWELVQAYFTTDPGNIVTQHFIIRRKEALAK